MLDQLTHTSDYTVQSESEQSERITQRRVGPRVLPRTVMHPVLAAGKSHMSRDTLQKRRTQTLVGRRQHTQRVHMPHKIHDTLAMNGRKRTRVGCSQLREDKVMIERLSVGKGARSNGTRDGTRGNGTKTEWTFRSGSGERLKVTALFRLKRNVPGNLLPTGNLVKLLGAVSIFKTNDKANATRITAAITTEVVINNSLGPNRTKRKISSESNSTNSRVGKQMQWEVRRTSAYYYSFTTECFLRKPSHLP
jgi:hypothetical protein